MNRGKIALLFLLSAFLVAAVYADDIDEENVSEGNVNEENVSEESVSEENINEVNVNEENINEVNVNEGNMNINPGLYIGLTGGITNNTLHTSTGGRDYTEYQDGGGFEIAIPLRYVIYPWLAVQAEVQYIQKNYSWARTGTYDEIYCKVNNNYIDIPVMLNVSAGDEKTRFFINAGGYASYWINSKIEGAMREMTTDPFNPGSEYYSSFSETVELNDSRDVRFQAGLLAGAGIQMFSDRFTFFVEGRFYYGLTDMRNESDYGFIIPRMNNTFNIRIGVFVTIDSIMDAIGGGK